MGPQEEGRAADTAESRPPMNAPIEDYASSVHPPPRWYRAAVRLIGCACRASILNGVRILLGEPGHGRWMIEPSGR